MLIQFHSTLDFVVTTYYSMADIGAYAWDIMYKVEFYSLLRLTFSVGIIIGPTAFFSQTHYIDNGLLLSLKSGYIEFGVV